MQKTGLLSIFKLTNETSKISVGGLLFGLIFPVVAWIIDINYNDYHFIWDDVVKMHQNNPIHFIIDLAPLVLYLV